MALVLAVVSGLCVLLWLGFRDRRIGQLEEVARGINGTDPAIDAVRALGDYGESRAVDILLRLATSRYSSGSSNSEVRVEAIAALAKREDPAIPGEVARLLQPFQPYNVRFAAAQALEKLRCEKVCTEYVLAYLERVHHGELNEESRVLDDVARAELESTYTRLQQDLYDILYGILARSDSTLGVLREIYGLRSGVPAEFAVTLLSKAHIPGVCQDLQDVVLMLDVHPERVREKDNLSAAIKLQGCRETQ
jgi:hypothetical protein